MVMKTNKILLIAILLLAALLRFWRLGDYPAINADEAAIGYNAYSLLETGHDEHGNPWPIHFQSFNDYKPGLYFYLVLPFVKYMGLNAWAVRLPGALLGVGTVLVVYLLVSELGKYKQVFALTSALFLAISPWHIHFSRGGWEVNAATFFITTGVWLFLKSVRNKLNKKHLALSLLLFAASLYTYHAVRIVVPLLGLGLVFIYKKDLFKKQNIKYMILNTLFLILLLIPLAIDLAGPAGISRAAGVGLFADTGPLARINEQRGEHADFTGLPAVLLHNKAVNYGLAFLENWSEHFHGEFLFLSGDVIQRNRVPETGQMYLLDILFLIVGVIGAIGVIGEKSSQKKAWVVIIWWLVVAPTAAALTFQSPHALRAHNMVIPLVMISAFGLIYLSLWLHRVAPNKRLLDLIFVLFVIVISWNFTRDLHMYYIHMAKEYPFSSQYGVPELVEYVEEDRERFEKVVVTDRYDQPYILFLFYLKYPPDKFQEEHKLSSRDKFGFSTVREFDKYLFTSIDFQKTKEENPRSLIVGTDEEIPDEANIVKEIYGSNGYKYFQVVAN